MNAAALQAKNFYRKLKVDLIFPLTLLVNHRETLRKIFQESSRYIVMMGNANRNHSEYRQCESETFWVCHEDVSGEKITALVPLPFLLVLKFMRLSYRRIGPHLDSNLRNSLFHDAFYVSWSFDRPSIT